MSLFVMFIPSKSAAPPRGRAGFSLLEIMIAVTIIGLLCMIAIPAFMRLQQASRSARFLSDLRTFAQAFENYTLVNGDWPATATGGAIPAGMTDDIRSAWTVRNSVGGEWNWDRDGTIAGISTTNITASEADMTVIDAKIDDGVLTTGAFQKIGDRFTYILHTTL